MNTKAKCPSPSSPFFMILPIFLIGLTFFVGCGSTDKKSEVSPEQQVGDDTRLGNALAEKLNTQLKFKKDEKVVLYLQRLSKLILEHAPPNLKNMVVDIRIIDDHKDVWKNLGLPDGSLYLSSGILSRIEFENEIAGLLSMLFAQIEGRHHFKTWQPKRDVARSEIIENLLSFNEEDAAEAIKTAVNLMYEARFDPRGLISVWELLERNKPQSPYSQKQLTFFTRETRSAIVKYSPLRNPIVRRSEFLAILKRIKQL